MYIRSTSGRSSLSTLMLTKCSFIILAISWFSKDSCSITWHQWQVEYPTDKNISLSSLLAFSKASSPQGYHLTGFDACCSKYGDFSKANLFCCFAKLPESLDEVDAILSTATRGLLQIKTQSITIICLFFVICLILLISHLINSLRLEVESNNSGVSALVLRLLCGFGSSER